MTFQPTKTFQDRFQLETDDEYEKFIRRMNPPRVIVDNSTSENATIVKVDSSVPHGMLLEVLQILGDLDLTIKKSYISSDCGWFMDVFHVTDSNGNKVTNEDLIDSIQKSAVINDKYSRRVGVESASEHTVIEITGIDRTGLLSEIFALLTNLKCNVVAAELWTHNMRVAGLLFVTDATTFGPVEDTDRLRRIKESLYKVLKGDEHAMITRTGFLLDLTHAERRLHQMMYAARDYERIDKQSMRNSEQKITVENCDERGYSLVNIEYRDRPKLMFDIVCTLTDMEYVVFHAIINSDGEKAYMEYYIRHMDGCILNSEAERERVIQCLRAAMERRVSAGLRLELCTSDRVGLLSDVTRIFREHGLSVTRADVSTRGDKAVNVFYVTDASGEPVDLKAIEDIRKEIGKAVLYVKEYPPHSKSCPREQTTKLRFPFGNLFGRPSQVLHNLGLMKSFA